LQNNIKLTIENLEKAIKFNPDKYAKIARTDPDFHKVRDNKKFQALLQVTSK
jgi:hypothetical protein